MTRCRVGRDGNMTKNSTRPRKGISQQEATSTVQPRNQGGRSTASPSTSMWPDSIQGSIDLQNEARATLRRLKYLQGDAAERWRILAWFREPAVLHGVLVDLRWSPTKGEQDAE